MVAGRVMRVRSRPMAFFSTDQMEKPRLVGCGAGSRTRAAASAHGLPCTTQTSALLLVGHEARGMHGIEIADSRLATRTQRIVQGEENGSAWMRRLILPMVGPAQACQAHAPEVRAAASMEAQLQLCTSGSLHMWMHVAVPAGAGANPRVVTCAYNATSAERACSPGGCSTCSASAHPEAAGGSKGRGAAVPILLAVVGQVLILGGGGIGGATQPQLVHCWLVRRVAGPCQGAGRCAHEVIVVLNCLKGLQGLEVLLVQAADIRCQLAPCRRLMWLC